MKAGLTGQDSSPQLVSIDHGDKFGQRLRLGVLKDRVPTAFNRPHADPESTCNDLVGVAFDDELQNLHFLGSEHGQTSVEFRTFSHSFF